MPVRTVIADIRAGDPDRGIAARAAEVLGRGGVLAYPTETFYALGAAAATDAAIERIYRLKERDRGKPLSVVVADLTMALACADSPPALFADLAAAFWPGPLTLIVRAGPGFPARMLGPGGSCAMRVPGLPWLRGFLGLFGGPVTATSANLSGTGEISSAAEVVRLFEGRADMIVNGGDTAGGRPSTIVDCLADPPCVVRQGAVPADALRPYLSAARAAG